MRARNVSAAVEKLRRELRRRAEALGQAAPGSPERPTRARQGTREGKRLVVAQLEGATVELLRAIAGRVTEVPSGGGLAGISEEAALVVVREPKTASIAARS